MKVAVGRCPAGVAIDHQPSGELAEQDRCSAALLDQFGATVKPARVEILDINDTFCAAHGGHRTRLWCRSRWR
jgi:hypothetical protein